MSFDLSKMNEVKTIIKYTLIKFVDVTSTGIENIIKVIRACEGELVKAPEYTRENTTNANNKIYYIYSGWKNLSNELIANSENDYSFLTPEINTTYYLNLESISIPKVAKILMTAPGTTNQTMIEPFEIIAPYNVYLSTSSDCGYNIIATCTNTSLVDNRKTTVTFIVSNYIYSAGQTVRLSPEFTIYKNSNLTEEIGKFIIDIDIESSSQSTGD